MSAAATAIATALPTVHLQMVDLRMAEVPGQMRCLPVPEQMDRRQAALAQDEQGRRIMWPHIKGGYFDLVTTEARPVSEAAVGADVLVEMPGEGIWRAARVEAPRGFVCPVHKLSLRPRGGRLSCRQCEAESGRPGAEALVEKLGTGWPTVLPPDGVRGVTGYAWSIRPLDEAARECNIDGGGAFRYGYGQGEIEPAHDADWLFDQHLHGSEVVEHVVVTLGPQAPAVPRLWGVAPLRPLRAKVLCEDPTRPVFAVRAAGPLEELHDWTLQKWVYGVGC